MDKQAFKQRMQNLKSYRDYSPGKGYIQFMEELAKAKSKEWKEDEDMTLLQMLNDNTYNYKQMYEDNPDYNIQEGHFKDTYKTVYHPTFSNESMYSGQKSQYNPEGIIGGWWDYDNKIFHANPKQDLNYTQWYLDREDPGWKVQAYQDGGEVDEFQRKTRRDIMQESLVDGRPDYNKMFQNQNEYQKDFANYWYTERAKNPKYSDQIGGDKLSSVLSNIDKATWKTPTEAMRDNMVGQGYNPTDAQINQQLNILKEKSTKGFANPKSHSYTSLRPANTWHEGIGHMVGDNTPAILNATPNVRISSPDSSYEDYVNQANEKHAQTWDFRGNNSNLKDDQGNYYIDPNRQLTPEDISNMRSKGAKIPEQWESLEDADISELTNTFAYNLSQDPIYYMANGGEIGDPDDEFAKAVNTKLGRTPDGRPLQQGLKPVFDLEDAANLTPVGDAIAAKDMYNAAMDKDWTGLGLAAASMIPFMPMTVKQFRKKYKGVTPKPAYSSDSKLMDKKIQDRINELEVEKARREAIINNSKTLPTKANNEGYNIVEALMDDPSYLARAAEVKNKFGDNYARIYADIIQDYNTNPNRLPKSTIDLNLDPEVRAQMRANKTAQETVNKGGRKPDRGDFELAINPENTDLSGNVTLHEWNHYTDYIKNKSPKADANSPMFYQMSKDMDGVRVDDNDSYFSLPTEQKAYMNQLREYLFNTRKINRRGDKVSQSLIKDSLKELERQIIINLLLEPVNNSKVCADILNGLTLYLYLVLELLE